MVIFTARIKAFPGKGREAASRLREMVAAVKAQEENAWAYCCHNAKDNPDEFLFYEIYADQAALDVHNQTPHFAKLKELFGDVLDPAAGVQIETLDIVDGFFRMPESLNT